MKDKDGITAVMFACYHGHVGAVKVLINAGSCADYMSREGEAAACIHPFEYLSHRATCIIIVGKTAIQLARNSGHNDSVQAILDGPTFLLAELDDLRDMTACGWVISVLRAPEGSISTTVLMMSVLGQPNRCASTYTMDS